MIAKISTSNNPRGALNYNCEKVAEGGAKILCTNKLWQKEDTIVANQFARVLEKKAVLNKNTSNNFYKSKKITNEIEKKYGLHPADMRKNTEIWTPGKIDPTKNISSQIRHTVKHLIKNYHFQSFNEFKTLLSLYNIDAQELQCEAGGTPYNGLIYFATDDNRNRLANPVKSSILGKFAGAANLSKKYTASIPLLKTSSVYIKDTLSNAMSMANTEKGLMAILKKRGMDLILRKNDSGRIYGATIIDHHSKMVMNGSRLGKEFSANRFQELFSPPDSAQKITQEKTITPEQPVFSFTLGNTSAGLMPRFAGSGPSVFRKKKKKKKTI